MGPSLPSLCVCQVVNFFLNIFSQKTLLKTQNGQQAAHENCQRKAQQKYHRQRKHPQDTEKLRGKVSSWPSFDGSFPVCCLWLCCLPNHPEHPYVMTTSSFKMDQGNCTDHPMAATNTRQRTDCAGHE